MKTTPRECKRSFTPWLLAGGACLILDMFFLGPALFTRQVRVPADITRATPPYHLPQEGPPRVQNPLLSDWSRQFQPWRKLVREAWLQGRAPLWNPLAGGGQPLLANMQCEALSPFLGLNLLFKEQAPDARQLAQMLLAQILALCLAGALALGPLPALVVALGYSFASPMQAWACHPQAASAAFAPGILLGFLLLRRRKNRRALAFLALMIGASILAGHLETACMAGLAGLLVALWLPGPPKGGLTALVSFHLRAVLATSLGLALAGALLLPFLSYLDQSALLSFRLSRLQPPLAPFHLFTWLDQKALGDPLQPGLWRGARNFMESAFFPGRILLFLSLVALLRPGRKRGRLVCAVGLTLLAGCLVAYGPKSLHEFLGKIPPLDRMPLQRFHFLATLPLALLAGVGLEQLGRKIRPGQGTRHLWAPLAAGSLLAGAGLATHLLPQAWVGLARVSFGSSGLFLLAAVVWLLSRRWATKRALGQFGTALFPLAVGLEGVLVWQGFIPLSAQESLQPRAAILADARRLVGSSLLLPLGTLLPPELQITPRLRSLRAHDALGLLRHERLLQGTGAFSHLGTRQQAVSVPAPILDLRGVRWVLTPWPPELAPWPVLQKKISASKPLQVTLPRAPDHPLEFLFWRPAGPVEAALNLRVRFKTEDGSYLVLESGQPMLAGGPASPGSLTTRPDAALRDLLATLLPHHRVRYLSFRPARPGMPLTIQVGTSPGGTSLQAVLLARQGLGRLTESCRRGPWYLARRPTALPRAYLAPRPHPVPGLKTALRLVRSPEFDPHRETLIECPPGEPLPRDSLEPREPQEIAVQSLDPEHLRIPLNIQQTTLVVLTDTFARGWEATLDGQSVPIMPANVTGRGVLVPRGRHVLRFRYQPWPWKGGLLLSGTTLMLITFFLLRGGRRSFGAHGTDQQPDPPTP